MGVSEFRTEEERVEARRQAMREAVRRHQAKKRGVEVPNTPAGIARWWKRRGH